METPVIHIDEYLLLQQLRDGDHDAFTGIYKRYHPELYLYAFRLVEDEEQAADFVQEVFIYLWDKREQLSISSSLRSYLYRSVRHKFLNLTEHHKVRAAFATGFQEILNKPVDSTADAITEKELSEYLTRLVANLPGKMGQVFDLRQQNLSDEAIAKQLGISPKTVRNLLSQTMKKLQLKLKYFVFSLLF